MKLLSRVTLQVSAGYDANALPLAPIEITWAKYPAGEVRLTTPDIIKTIEAGLRDTYSVVSLLNPSLDTSVAPSVRFNIQANLLCAGSIMVLAQVKHIIDNIEMSGEGYDYTECAPSKVLTIPYVPYGRQDKTSSDVGNECLSLAVFANIINSFQFDRVQVVEPHSPMTLKLLNNSEVLDVNFPNWIRRTVSTSTHLAPIVVVSPDRGARARSAEIKNGLIELLGIGQVSSHVIAADKVRDPATGAITRIDWHEDETEATLAALDGARVVVFDDICDGGGTFIGLSELINSVENCTPQSIDLYVVHGFFTKGKEVLDPHFTSVQALYDYSRDFQ